MITKDIKLNWAVICRNTSLDPLSKTISLNSIVEKIDVEIEVGAFENSPISINFPFEIVSNWGRENQDISSISCKINLFDPIGNDLMNNVIPLDFLDEDKYIRSVIHINSLQISISGTYTLLISARENLEDRYHKFSSLPLEIFIHYKDSDAKSIAKFIKFKK